MKKEIRNGCKGCPRRIIISSIYTACSGPTVDFGECMSKNNMKSYAHYIPNGIAKPRQQTKGEY